MALVGRVTSAPWWPLSPRRRYHGESPSTIDLAGTACLAGILMRAKRGTHLTETPLTGKPDAGNPPVRFGGRGEVNPTSLPLSILLRRGSVAFCRQALSRLCKDLEALGH